MDEEKNKIEDLRDVLYSRQTDGIFEKKRHDLKIEHPIPEKHEWENEEVKEKTAVSRVAQQIPYKKILIVSFLFFALASIFAFYEFSGGLNTISSDKINILVSGPATVSGGQVFPLDIEVDNKGVSTLKIVDLKIEYPDGTVSPDDLSSPLKRYTQSLGDINVGDSAKTTIKAALFGQENEQKTIKVRKRLCSGCWHISARYFCCRP